MQNPVGECIEGLESADDVVESEHGTNNLYTDTAVSTWDVLPSLVSTNGSSCSKDIDHDKAVKMSSTWVTLAHSCNSSFEKPLSKQLWELPTAFDNVSFRWPDRTVFPELVHQSEVNDPRVNLAGDQTVREPPDKAWKTVAARMSRLLDRHDEDGERDYAIRKWRTIIQISPKHTAVGRTLLQCILDLHVDDQLNSTLLDIFSMKATKTILNRAQRFAHFVVWCHQKNMSPIPVQEHIVYLYLYDNVWKGPTSANSFKESLAFAGSVVGIDGALQSSQSQRVSGFCKRKYLDKKPLKQSRVLTVRQVQFLESLVVGADSGFDVLDRIMAGHCLFNLYARSRWSDSMKPKLIELDSSEEQSGYFQADVLASKTSTTVQKKTRFLPLTGPLQGLTCKDWLQEWLHLRSTMKMPEPNGKSPLIFSVSSAGKFTNRPLTSSQASKWLRDLLTLGGSSREEVAQVSSHSLKATTLSWLAKYGVPLHSRQILGYHITGQANSALHYSRDELSTPLRELDKVILDIREGRFKPDATRSGYLAPTAKSAASSSSNTVIKSKGDLASASESSSDSDDDSNSIKSRDLSDDEMLDRVVPQDTKSVTHKRRKTLCANAGDSFFVHIRYRTLHASHKHDPQRMGCGRTVTVAYRPVAFSPSFDYPQCADCFGRED